MIAEQVADDRIPLFGLGTTVLRSRWRIARWALLGGVIALAPVIAKPLTYRASASFIPQGYESGRSGLAGIAGQFGISLNVPTGNQSLSPDFYVQLLSSRVLLRPIVDDSFAVTELGSRRIPFMELLAIQGGTPASREERAVRALSGMISTTVVRTTGVVELAVTSLYRSLSLAVAAALVNGINDYNTRVRQGQAGAERKFVEGRLAVAGDDLQVAEDGLSRFMRANRNVGSSPELAMERDRLERDVGLKQQLLSSLAQSYEDVRIREVRDTPVITMFELPSAPTRPEPRGRLSRLLFGLMVGGFLGVMIVLASAFMTHRRMAGDADAAAFVGALREMRGDVLRPVWWVRKMVRR